MKKIIIGSLGLMLQMAGFGQSKQWTLQQCIETAWQNNQQVQQSELQMERDEVNLKQSKANMLPVVNGSIDYGANQGRSINPYTNTYVNQQLNFSNLGVNGNLPLFGGFQVQNFIKQNNLAYKASKMEWQQAKDLLTLNVIVAYLQELNNEDLVTQSQDQLDVTKKQVDRLETLNNEGAIAPYTLSDLKGQLASDEVSLVNAKNNVQAAKLSLAQFMNQPYDESMQLERTSVTEALSLYDGNVESIYEEALKKLGMVQAADLRKESAEKAIKVAKGNFYPTLSLFGGLGTSYSSAAQLSSLVSETYGPSDSYVTVNGTDYPLNVKQQNFKSEPFGFGKQYNNNLYTNFGLSLQVPLSNNMRAHNQLKLAKIAFKNSQLLADNMRIQLRQNVEQAYFNMTAAYNRYQSYQQQVAALKESYNAAQVRFETGVITSVEYLQVKNTLDRANINLTQSKYEYVLRTKVLDYYQGKLNW